MGQNLQFVPGVEGYQVAEGRFLGQQLPPALVEKEPFNEIFTDFRIMQPAFILHWQQRKASHENPGEEPDPGARPHPPLIINLDPGHAAAGGFGLEDEAIQVFPGQFFDPLCGPTEEALGQVLPGTQRDEMRRRRLALQAHGLPGHPQAACHLRAYRHEFHVLPQGIGDERVQAVPAVVAHLFSPEAGAEAQLNF